MNVPALLIPEDLIDRGARSDRSVATTVFALLAIASLLPTLLTPIPAMVDYLNHLARMYLLSQMGTPMPIHITRRPGPSIPIWRWTWWSRQWRG